VPPWLNEGLAELYSTVRRDGSQAVVGAWSADLYKSGYQPNVREVFAAHEPFSAEPGNYTESSALVHLLQSERRSYRARFLRFIGALRQGVRWDLAWREVFAGLDLDALEREINGYRFITLRVDTRRVPIQPSPAVTPTLRPMRDGEVHLVWLEVRRRVNAADRARAWRDLAEATKRSEDATELALWRAALTRDEGKQVEAVAILRAALAAVPDDRRLLYAVLTLVEDPAVGERLSHVARSSEELIMAARYDGSHPGDALPLAQRAVALSPASMNAWFELATVMKMLGRLDEARRAMQRAAWLRPSNGGLALEMRSLEASARASGLPALSPPFGVLASPLFESPRGMSFSGRVVTDGDRSFAGCVELSSGGDYVFARLDERGAFQARVLPGEVTLTVLPDAVELLADQFAHHVKPQLSSVDLGVHRVTLEPAPLTAYDGIETFSRDQKVIVSQVQEGSPADAAGVRRDDVLLSIDGRSVAGFGENGVNALLAGPAATEKTLVMQRGHEAPRTVRFQLAPRRATDGALQQ
jgi:tetratricopeptide (TPR) repeat protein